MFLDVVSSCGFGGQNSKADMFIINGNRVGERSQQALPLRDIRHSEDDRDIRQPCVYETKLFLKPQETTFFSYCWRSNFEHSGLTVRSTVNECMF